MSFCENDFLMLVFNNNTQMSKYVGYRFKSRVYTFWFSISTNPKSSYVQPRIIALVAIVNYRGNKKLIL